MTKGLASYPLFISSLFYFRVPRNEWRDRLEKVKAAGYDAVDVYIPWNFHERVQGQFTFEGQADVGTFLDLTAEVGLYAIARPGPYICSEWDGGALPSWLNVLPGVQLRQVEPNFLACVARWYERVLPIVRQRQVHCGGAVLAVQVDNELDFYPCLDPRGYIEALVDLVRSHGIETTVTACIGQWDYEAATGDSALVLPMVNVYPPDSREPELDEKLDQYVTFMKSKGNSPLTMETGRDAFLHARLLAAGFWAISPYNMVSGVNMDAWHAVNNWGEKPTYIATDYDFGGMVTADGRLREEFFAQRRLTGAIRALREVITSGEPTAPVDLVSSSKEGTGLRLRTISSSVGDAHFVFNLGEARTESRISLGDEKWPVALASGDYTILWEHVHLIVPEVAGRFVVSANGMPVAVQISGKTVYMAVQAGASGLLTVKVEHAHARVVSAPTTSDRVMTVDLSIDESSPGYVYREWTNGVRFVCVGLSPRSAGRIWESPEGGFLIGPRLVREWLHKPDGRWLLRGDWDDEEIWLANAQGVNRLATHPLAGDGKRSHLNTDATLALNPGSYVSWTQGAKCVSGFEEGFQTLMAPVSMEALGILFGRVRYSAQTQGPISGLRLPPTADLAWVYVNGRCVSVVAAAGESHECTWDSVYDGDVQIDVVVESWGHSNFHDTDRPSIQLGSTRGMFGEVLALPSLSPIVHWQMGLDTWSPSGEIIDCASDSGFDRQPLPFSAGERAVFRGSFYFPQGSSSRVVHLTPEVTNARVDVRVNGILLGRGWTGPDLHPQLVGGAANEFWLRPEVCQSSGVQRIEVELLATGPCLFSGLRWDVVHDDARAANQWLCLTDVPVAQTSS